MKKLIALLTVFSFAVAFASCGKKTETTASEPETEQVAPEEETVPADTLDTEEPVEDGEDGAAE